MARRGQKPGPSKGPPEPGLFDAVPAPAEAPAVREPRRFTVGELTDEIRARLGETGRVAVEGELSSLKRHGSGHVYFDLKDANARLACVVWRSRVAQALAFTAEEGMQVVARGRLDVYAPRGSYSLVVDKLEPLGTGALLARLEALKAELRTLGWFDRRRPLPARPDCIGLVTSKGAAALHDFLRTRSLRWPGYPVRLCHAAVQGPGSALEVADAIERLDASGVDVIVVCRGGGSLEDLWTFNERVVAEAIRATSVPVVTGIGHESDTTLADLVADHRAHTPTDAAQAVVPDRAALAAELSRFGNHLVQAVDQVIERRQDRLRALLRRPLLRRPELLLERRREVLRDRASRLVGALRGRLDRSSVRLSELETRLVRQSPRLRLERRSSRLVRAAQGLRRAVDRRLEGTDTRLLLLVGRLEAISPLRVLARGYSLTTRPGEHAPLLSTRGLAPGDELETRLAEGTFLARVSETRPANSPAIREDGP